MSKVVFISEEIKNLLIDNPAYCTIDEMKTIVSDYNTDSGISKNEIFILGYNLSMVRRDLVSELSITGRSSDRLVIDGIDTLVKSIFTVDHETSLTEQFRKQNEVRIVFDSEMWEVYKTDSDLSFHSETNYELVTKWCEDNNYDIVEVDDSNLDQD